MYSANCTAKLVSIGLCLSVICQLLETPRKEFQVIVPVSPASPENAIRVCLFSALVLSSSALRIVAPRIAALEAAMMVKSLPVMPNRTSLYHDVRHSFLKISCERMIRTC